MSWEVPTMRSKTSCFNKTIFWKHVTRFWPVWGAYLAIWLLLMPVGLLSTRNYLLNNPASLQQSVLDAIRSGTVLSFIFSALTAMAVWSFLYSARSASGAACLPVTRTAQFTSAVLGGLLPLAASNVLTFVLTLLAELSLGVLHLPSLLTWLAVTLLHLVFFYGFATFCAMLTGNIIILPAVYAVLNFVAAGLQVLLDGVVKFFLYGVEELGGSWLYYLSPAVEMMRSGPVGVTVYDPAREAYITVGWRYAGWASAGIYAAAGALLLLAAWALLRRRRMEAAGDTVAVGALKPVFRWCMGVFGGLCFAVMMLYVFGLTGGETQRAVFAATAAYLVIGAFLGWFVAEMLIRRTFRVFRGGWRGFGGWAVCCVALLAALSATELDVLGLERRQPAEDRIEAVVVRTWGANSGEAYLDTRESIAQAMALHRGIIERKPEQDQCDQKDYFLRGAPRDLLTVEVDVVYCLKNGGTLSRTYTLPHRYDAAGDDAVAVQALLNCPEAVKNRRETPFDFTAENVSYGSVSAVMTARECAAAAGYDDPETYVLCELAGYSRAEADAMPERDRILRETLQNLRYLEDGLYYAYDEYMEKYPYDKELPPLPEDGGAIDWDRIWLEYSTPLTAQEAWELYSDCVAPDLAANALGRVWILPGSDYAATVCAASVEIDARWPEESTGNDMEIYDGMPMTVQAAVSEVRYYGFSAVPTVDSARTNAWLEARGIRLYTVGEIRAAQAG